MEYFHFPYFKLALLGDSPLYKNAKGLNFYEISLKNKNDD